MPRQSQWLDEAGAFQPIVVDLNPETIVHDRKNNMQIMRIRGVVTLPIGTEIELTQPNINVRVVGVRLLAATGSWPASVCLDVEVPDTFWDQVVASGPA